MSASAKREKKSQVGRDVTVLQGLRREEILREYGVKAWRMPSRQVPNRRRAEARLACRGTRGGED